MKLSSAVALGSGGWVFAEWGRGYDHVCALPLITSDSSLAIALFNSDSGELCLRLLVPLGGRTRPLEQLALTTRLEPLTGGPATRVCLAEDATGGLLFIRYSSFHGSASAHRLGRTSSGTNAPTWNAKHLGSFELAPAHDVFLVFPVQVPLAQAVLLQYNSRNGAVKAWRANFQSSLPLISDLWAGHWMPQFPNQQISCISGSWCLVEYMAERSILNVGRFSEEGHYAYPHGDWWRCQIPQCKVLRGVWPPSGDLGAMALLDHADEDRLVICGLPLDPEGAEPRGPHGNRFSSVWWTTELQGVVTKELLAAIREENWMNRRAALLLSRMSTVQKYLADDYDIRQHEPMGSHDCPLWLLRALSVYEGVWRKVIAML